MGSKAEFPRALPGVPGSVPAVPGGPKAARRSSKEPTQPRAAPRGGTQSPGFPQGCFPKRGERGWQRGTDTRGDPVVG